MNLQQARMACEGTPFPQTGNAKTKRSFIPLPQTLKSLERSSPLIFAGRLQQAAAWGPFSTQLIGMCWFGAVCPHKPELTNGMWWVVPWY